MPEQPREHTPNDFEMMNDFRVFEDSTNIIFKITTDQPPSMDDLRKFTSPGSIIFEKLVEKKWMSPDSAKQLQPFKTDHLVLGPDKDGKYSIRIYCFFPKENS